MICCKSPIDSIEIHLGELTWSFAWHEALPATAQKPWFTAEHDNSLTVTFCFSLQICSQSRLFLSVHTCFLQVSPDLKTNPARLLHRQNLTVLHERYSARLLFTLQRKHKPTSPQTCFKLKKTNKIIYNKKDACNTMYLEDRLTHFEDTKQTLWFIFILLSVRAVSWG